MKIKAFFNFIEGKSAQFLINKFEAEFTQFRNIEISKIQTSSTSKLTFKNGFAFYQKGEDEYMLFYYLPKYNILKHEQLPKYHIVKCKSRQNYMGYTFSNQMPVDVFNKDNSITLKDQYLDICKNCLEEAFIQSWEGSLPWHEAILNYIENQENPTFMSDGYHVMWKQISNAFRESCEWECQDCGIKLDAQDERMYLHTHHRNGNIKDNRKDNFASLCLLCHALKHKDRMLLGSGFLEVSTFINKFRSRLRDIELFEYARLHEGRFTKKQ